jgi:hypothetical protein
MERRFCYGRGRGLIGVQMAVLTNLGEKMSDEEVDELLKAVDTSSGEINYTGNEAPRDSSTVQGFLADALVLQIL